MKYFLQTFGCQMNKTDSERVCAVVEHLGYKVADKMEFADLVIFNTCSIRQTAEDRVHGSIGKMAKFKKKNPKLKIAVTGCMVRQSSSQNSENRDELLKTHKKLDCVFRIEDLAKIDKILLECDPNLDIKTLEDEGTLENYFKIHPRYSDTFKAYVPIQTGCDKFCTYCIVPFTRGREYSRDFQEILSECKKLVEGGAKEITLLGQTVNTYGISKFDKMSKKFINYSKYPFVDLLTEVDKLKKFGLKWLRFASPYPKDFSDELIDAMASLETVCPHVHMPVQSGCDEMLKVMNRNYTIEEYVTLVDKFRLKIPGISITTDIIVGFPGETNDIFDKTCKFYEDMQFDLCYSAKYSPRKGTYSEKFLKDEVLSEEKTKRWRKLNKIAAKYCYTYLTSFVGSEQEVLVEEEKAGYFYARNAHNKMIRFKSERRNLIGEFIYVRMIEAFDWLIEAEL